MSKLLRLFVQVDWADPDIEGYVTELMNNRSVCVRNLPRNVPEFQIRDFFNSLSSGQVENILRTAGYVLITFITPEAAKTVMEVGGALEVGGARIHLSWWLDRDVYSSQPRPAGKPGSQPARQQASQPAVVQPPALNVQEMIGPVEKLHQVSMSQGWGVPQYSCASYLDSSNQQLYQYSVMVPAVPNTLIPGEANQDRQLAMLNCACAALQGIARETQRRFSSENTPSSLSSLTRLQGPHLQSVAPNTASASVLTSQGVAGLNQRPRKAGNKARKGGAAHKKLQARYH